MVGAPDAASSQPGGRAEATVRSSSRDPRAPVPPPGSATGVAGADGEAERVARHVDAVLLDSGAPDAAQKTLGGTGRTHDWAVSRAIRERLSVPVFLAGGLRPGNVAEAVRQVGPWGLDVCSGVRVDGVLGADRLAAFAAEAGVQRLA